MRARWRIRAGRDALAAALAISTVAVASLIFLITNVPNDTADAVWSWRFEAATAAALIAIAFALRGRPGFAYPILAFASASVAGSIENAANAVSSYAASSYAALGAAAPRNDAASGLILLTSLARTGIPAAILTLYATAPERRLARWVTPAAWALTITAITVAILRLGLSFDPSTKDAAWAGTPILAYQLDEPILVLAVGVLGILGSLRTAGRAHVPAEPEPAPSWTAPAVNPPSRALLAAVAAAAVLWVPATVAFINRSTAIDDGDEIKRVFLVPIAAALVGVVAERWSRLAGWLAVAVAFEAIAFLVLYRGVADYVAYALTLSSDHQVPLTLSLVMFVGAAAVVVLFAFAALSLGFREAAHTPTITTRPSATAAPPLAGWAEETHWALGGAVVGVVLFGWFLARAFLGDGFFAILTAGLFPVYAIPIALGLGIWRRLVPAVAEAELVAMAPFRPLHYLETVVAEALTRRAEHRRSAARAERARLASELDAGLLPNLERLRSTTVAGAPRDEVADRLRDVQVTLHRLIMDGQQVAFEPAFADGGPRPVPSAARSDLRRPSSREIDVLRLVVDGGSNEEIARALVLSLKTVESHLRRLFDRYEVANRTELAVLAIREGWVDEP